MLRMWKVSETSMCRHVCIAAIWALILALLTLVACGMPPATPAPGVVILLGTPVGISDQAVATAEIVRADAQATLDSANATLSAAQIQQKNSADVVAAQIAAAAAIVRANAQATLVAAGSTQSAALTQDAIRQTQAQYDLQGTQAAAGTQTAAANNIATQTQSALATSQWYADQSRQRQEQSWGSIAFLGMWCLPIFIVLLAGLVLWGFWRWLKIRQANQRILGNPVEKLPAPAAEVIDHRDDEVDRRYWLTKPVDQTRRWLDEVKRKLLSSDKKDEEDDNTDK